MDTLRCAQAVHYDIEQCLEYIKRSLSWFYSNHVHYPNGKIIETIQRKKCYIAGRTSKNEPVIFIDIEGMDSIMDNLSEAFVYLMFVTREYMHVRGYIETSVVLFDLKRFNSFIAGKYVKLILDILERSFYGMVSNIYFFGSGASMNYTINSFSSKFELMNRLSPSCDKKHFTSCELRQYR